MLGAGRTPEEEAAAAANYEAHADDIDQTSEPAGPPKNAAPRGVGTIVKVRFPAAEAATLRRLAEAEGRSLTDIIRGAVQRYAAGEPMQKPRAD